MASRRRKTRICGRRNCLPPWQNWQEPMAPSPLLPPPDLCVAGCNRRDSPLSGAKALARNGRCCAASSQQPRRSQRCSPGMRALPRSPVILQLSAAAWPVPRWRWRCCDVICGSRFTVLTTPPRLAHQATARARSTRCCSRMMRRLAAFFRQRSALPVAGMTRYR